MGDVGVNGWGCAPCCGRHGSGCCWVGCGWSGVGLRCAYARHQQACNRDASPKIRRSHMDVPTSCSAPTKCPCTHKPNSAQLLRLTAPLLSSRLPQVRQLSDYTRCTASPSGNVLARGRLLAHWGWRLVQVPAPAQLKAGAERLREAAEARRQEAAAARHAGAAAPGQVLQPRPQRKGADSAAATAQQAGASQQAQQEQEQRQEGQQGQGQQEQAGNRAGSTERVNLRPAIRAFLLRQPGLRSLLQSSGARQGGGRGRGRQRWKGRSGSRRRSAGGERA